MFRCIMVLLITTVFFCILAFVSVTSLFFLSIKNQAFGSHVGCIVSIRIYCASDLFEFLDVEEVTYIDWEVLLQNFFYRIRNFCHIEIVASNLEFAASSGASVQHQDRAECILPCFACSLPRLVRRLLLKYSMSLYII